MTRAWVSGLLVTFHLAASMSAAATLAAQDILRPDTVVRDLGVASVTSIARAPNGVVFVTADGGLYAYHPEQQRLALVHSASAGDIAVSPQGNLLAFARNDAEPTIWTLEVDAATGRATGHARRLSIRSGRAPAFSADGRSIAFSVLPANDTLAGPRIVRVPVGGGPEEVVAREPGYVQSLRWSPDGRWIYYRHGVATKGGRVRTLRRVAAGGGTSEMLASAGEFIGLSPDGARLAFIANMQFHRDSVKTIVIGDARGRELRRLTLVGRVLPTAWVTNDELLLLQTESRVSLRQAGVGSGQRELLGLPASARISSVSRDAKNVFIESRAGHRLSIARVDISSGRQDSVLVILDSAATLRWLGEGFALRDMGRSTLRVVEVGSGRSVTLSGCAQLLGIFPRPARAMCLGPSTDTVREVLAIDLHTGTPRVLRTIPFPEQYRPGVRLVGDTTLIIAYGGRVMIANALRGSVRTVYPAVPGQAAAVQVIGVSADGAWLAFVADSGSRPARQFLRVVSAQGSALRSLSVPVVVVAAPPIWSADNRYIAIAGEREGKDVILLVPLLGDPPAVVVREPFGVGLAAVTTSGDVIYTVARESFAVLTASLAVPATSPH